MKGKVAALVGPEEVTFKEFEIPDSEPGARLVKIRRESAAESSL